MASLVKALLEDKKKLQQSAAKLSEDLKHMTPDTLGYHMIKSQYEVVMTEIHIIDLTIEKKRRTK